MTAKGCELESSQPLFLAYRYQSGIATTVFLPKNSLDLIGITWLSFGFQDYNNRYSDFTQRFEIPTPLILLSSFSIVLMRRIIHFPIFSFDIRSLFP